MGTFYVRAPVADVSDTLLIGEVLGMGIREFHIESTDVALNICRQEVGRGWVRRWCNVRRIRTILGVVAGALVSPEAYKIGAFA